MNKEQKFYQALQDVFVGVKIEGAGGFINLMMIKANYYSQIEKLLKEDINKAVEEYPAFKEELFDKLHSFFSRYFTKSGSIYFNSTPSYNNIYEKVYTNETDVILFWKTQMLYYVKTDRIFRSMPVEFSDLKFYFDASQIENKKANEKRSLIFQLNKIREDETIVFSVKYSERGTKTKSDEILKDLKKKNIAVNEELLEKAFCVFEKQSEIDFFINKKAKDFLQEQFKLWSYQYFWDGAKEWSGDRVNQLQILKNIAFKVIDFISQFEDELVKIWNKTKFVRKSNYVITLDRITDKKIIEKIVKHNEIKEQIKEWQELGIVDEKFKVKDIENKKYEHLPIDTKHFKNLEFEILALFDDLDNQLDGWLIKSENYQALNTILPKFKEKVQTIYIDPPFNSPSSEIVYINQYKHSSWISLIENRLKISKQFLNKDKGIHIIAIDKNEQERLGNLIDIIFNEYEKTLVSVIHNPRGVQGDNFSFCNEYSYFLLPAGKKLIGKLKREDMENRNLRDNGGESLRTDAKNCFYPILVKDSEIVGFGDVIDKNDNPNSSNIKLKDGIFAVYPIDGSGIERKWRYARQSVEEIKELLNVKLIKDRLEIYKYKDQDRVRTVWTDAKYDANEYGKKLINHIIPNCNFDFPKSLHNVYDSISVCLNGTKNGVVLDYFGGSGTTVHAIMKYNYNNTSKIKVLLIEMGEHFNTTVIPRVKKIMFSSEWIKGSPDNSYGYGGFFKYFELEQYEETLANCKYSDGDLFSKSSEKAYQEYVFMKDEKMLSALEIDYKNNKVKVDLSKLYPDIDIAETLSNLTGKWIKAIKDGEVEFTDGSKINTKELDYKLIKPLIWWE
ncbi:MAG: site-specific DNA-methyltransferase [Candidatus Delongbacteria bacterium]|nr:site-specific DNA-methyltransferase [Candidatus Delongbacteria bacterium]